MSLRDEGFRYLVNRAQDHYGWYHPALVAQMLATGWVDCTDMSDDDLLAFFRRKGE